MNARDAARAIAQDLAEAGFADARALSRTLMAHALGMDRWDGLTDGDTLLAPDQDGRLRQWVDALKAQVPLAHVLGQTGFWTLDLVSDNRALIPRQDTESLVEAVLAYWPDMGPPLGATLASPQVLDLGTGSGAILLALLAERPACTGLGMDASPLALEQAKQNAIRNGLAGRVAFHLDDWHRAGWTDRLLAKAGAGEGAPRQDPLSGRFALVVSNPPYIASAQIATLDANVRDHDPLMALDGGPDGLEAYRAIVDGLAHLLMPGGLAAFEIGWDQGPALCAMLARAGLEQVTLLPDLAGRDRVVLASRPA